MAVLALLFLLWLYRHLPLVILNDLFNGLRC